MSNHAVIADYYTRHRDEVVGFVAVRIGDADEAQDMVQNIFLRLLDGHHLTTEVTLPCLVYTMARHMVADYYRRRRVYEEYEHYIRRGDSTEDRVESIFSARQVMERMERSLARLPEKCRQVYRLHIYDGLRVSEISVQLGEPYKSVENRLGQARRVVRQQLRACV